MHTLKTITLALLLMIFSVVGLRAEEISFEQFAQEFLTAIQAQNFEKAGQLLIDNPNTAMAFQQRLLLAGEGVGEEAELSRALAELMAKLLETIGSQRRSYPELDRLQEEGEKAFYRSDYPTALEKWHTGLKKAQELGDKAYISQFLGNLGVLYLNLGDYPKALDYYQQALAIDKEIGHKRGIGNNLTNLGVVYDHLDDYSKALEYYQQALAINKEFGNKLGQRNSFASIGVMHSKLGNYPKSLDYLKQALAIDKEVVNKPGQRDDLGNIGTVYKNFGDYSKALDYLKQALAIDKELDDKHAERIDLSNIGAVYSKLGNYPNALYYYQQALAIDKKIADKRGEGTDLSKIGTVYMDFFEDYPKALKHFQRALAIAEKLGDKRGKGTNLTNIGLSHLNLGDYPAALDYLKQALTIRQTIGDKQGQWENLTNIGIAYQNLGEFQKAKKAFQDSIAIEKSIGVGEIWLAQRGLASTEAKLNQPELAIEHYDQALDNLEKIRNRLTKAHKTTFMRKRIYVYDELITLLQSLHSSQPKKCYDRKAFETFERKQGRVFLEEMGQSGARRFAGLDNEIIEAEQSLAFKWQQAQSLSPQEYAALDEAEAQLKARIKAKSLKYYALKYPQPVELATLQNQVLQEGEMMLVYSVMKENTVLWVIGKQVFQMFTLPVDEKTLKQKIAQLRGYLSNRSFNRKFPKASLQLYQTLLPEAVRQLIKGAEILYIVPTGPLYGLPFGSLVTAYKPRREIHYLIEDYAISYLSSASLLKILREEKSKTPAPEPFLAFADPDYPPCAVDNEKGSETLAQLRTQSYLKSTKGGCFNRLAATADEVREIANLFKADHSKALYLGSKASRSTVFALNKDKKLDDYRYVMFSVHGVIPSQFNQIAQPALVLSNPLTEGYLTMADAFTLNLNADFVNLSACNTGCAGDSCGENVRGEGIMGLTRAFMYAGTARVAVTLWSVNLSSAKVFSVGLFRNLKASKKMADALRAIKLKMIQGKAGNQKYAIPYHWAPFVVYGDGQ
ncbi:MAG: CHAT domain-containing tetratricopeptide repeat protein [Candidatus Parabeggiatoa sp.]|nr:CHAT domain-containing tetratricopeptide repeat protein [Candidatus Parabeggiatoa sp.]